VKGAVPLSILKLICPVSVPKQMAGVGVSEL